MRIRGSARPAEIIMAAGRMSPEVAAESRPPLRELGGVRQHVGDPHDVCPDLPSTHESTPRLDDLPAKERDARYGQDQSERQIPTTDHDGKCQRDKSSLEGQLTSDGAFEGLMLAPGK
jgi:hypothetical protein